LRFCKLKLNLKLKRFADLTWYGRRSIWCANPACSRCWAINGPMAEGQIAEIA